MKATKNVLGVVKSIDTGYANHGTWAVGLWLGSEAEPFAYWHEAAREARRAARRDPLVREQHKAEAVVARSLLADRLQEEVCGEAPIVEPGLYSDLLRLALAEVDWDEVAEPFLDLPE